MVTPVAKDLHQEVIYCFRVVCLVSMAQFVDCFAAKCFKWRKKNYFSNNKSHSNKFTVIGCVCNYFPSAPKVISLYQHSLVSHERDQLR